MNYKIEELQRLTEMQSEMILGLLAEGEDHMLVEEHLEGRIRQPENENAFLEKENEFLQKELFELRDKVGRLELYITFLEDLD